MGSFGIVVVVLIGIVVVLMVVRLGISISATRRMNSQVYQSADGAGLGGVEPRGIDHHHNIGGHHNAGGHNVGGHNAGGHIGGGGHAGGGHHG